MNRVRVLVGLAAWLVFGAVLIVWAHAALRADHARGYRAAGELWGFATAKRRFVRLRPEPTAPLIVGAPIFRIDGPRSVEQVGEIRRPIPNEETTRSGGGSQSLFEALLYPNAPPVGVGSSLVYYRAPGSMQWVIETMLPVKKRALIAKEILTTYKTYHAEILDAVKPVIVASLVDAAQVAEDELSRAIVRRRGALDRLTRRYEQEMVEQQIVPLVRREIWPIVRRHAAPLANQIGQEMFARASVWRFGWRIAYDKSFLPEKNLTQAEWHRFVTEEALPILRRHQDDFAAVQRQVVDALARNNKVRDTLREALQRVVSDRELRGLAWQILREAIVDNPQVRATLQQRWNSAEARQAVQFASKYVEPCVRRIGDLLIGTRAGGISPEFARVVRNQILDKDRCWLVLVTPAGKTAPKERHIANRVLPVREGGVPDVNPFAIGAGGGGR